MSNASRLDAYDQTGETSPSDRSLSAICYWRSTADRAMCGPGASRPDPTAGMSALAHVPPPAIVFARRPYTHHACPRCGDQAYRDTPDQRTLHAVGPLALWCPRARGGTSAQPYGTQCRTDVQAARSALAPPGRPYPHRGSERAVRLGVEEGGPYRPARGPLWRDHRVFGPFATRQPWGEAGGKQGPGAPGPGLP